MRKAFVAFCIFQYYRSQQIVLSKPLTESVFERHSVSFLNNYSCESSQEILFFTHILLCFHFVKSRCEKIPHRIYLSIFRKSADSHRHEKEVKKNTSFILVSSVPIPTVIFLVSLFFATVLSQKIPMLLLLQKPFWKASSVAVVVEIAQFPYPRLLYNILILSSRFKNT